MSSVAARLADTVVAELNAGLLTPPTIATRSWLPRAELKELADTKVTVAPRSLSRQRASRSDVSREAVVDVAVQQQVGPSGESTIDSLVGLAEEIAAHFDGWECDDPAAGARPAPAQQSAPPDRAGDPYEDFRKRGLESDEEKLAICTEEQVTSVMAKLEPKKDGAERVVTIPQSPAVNHYNQSRRRPSTYPGQHVLTAGGFSLRRRRRVPL